MLKNLLHPISDKKQALNSCVASQTASVAALKVRLLVGFGFWGAANCPCCAFLCSSPPV